MVMLEFKSTHKCCPMNFFFFADKHNLYKISLYLFSITALTNSPKWNDLNLFHSSVVQKSCGLDWFVCLKSHKISIKMSARLSSHLKSLLGYLILSNSLCHQNTFPCGCRAKRPNFFLIRGWRLP